MTAKIISQKFNIEVNKTANVCYQDRQWIVMLYKNEQYLRSIIAYNEDEADDIAEDWVL